MIEISDLANAQGEAVEAVLITARARSRFANVTINDNSVNQTDPTSIAPVNVSMKPGKVTVVELKTVSEDGENKLTYSIAVNRSPRSYAELSNLTIDPGILVPSFSSSVTE
eukprot:SAG31_NODE_20213_length_581_cov_0.732365_2_plen_110_part_01